MMALFFVALVALVPQGSLLALWQSERSFLVVALFAPCQPFCPLIAFEGLCEPSAHLASFRPLGGFRAI